MVGTSREGPLNDEFRLVDVIWVMQKILATCVPATKAGLGGWADVGNGRGFYVSVNGHQAPRRDVEGLLNGTGEGAELNKTTMAVEGGLTQSFDIGGGRVQ